jgi:hypothetical protein
MLTADINPPSIMVAIGINAAAAGLCRRWAWFGYLCRGLCGSSRLGHDIRSRGRIAHTGYCAHRSCTFAKREFEHSLYMATLSIDGMRQPQRKNFEVTAQSRRAGRSLATMSGLHEAWIKRRPFSEALPAAGGVIQSALHAGANRAS